MEFDVWGDCHVGIGKCYHCANSPTKFRVTICEEVPEDHAKKVSVNWKAYRPEIVPTGKPSQVRR